MRCCLVNDSSKSPTHVAMLATRLMVEIVEFSVSDFQRLESNAHQTSLKGVSESFVVDFGHVVHPCERFS